MRKALISVSIVLLFVLGSEVRAAGGPTADVALNVTPPASMKVGTPSTWHGQLFAYFPSQDGTEDPVAAEINGGNRSFVAVSSFLRRTAVNAVESMLPYHCKSSATCFSVCCNPSICCCMSAHVHVSGLKSILGPHEGFHCGVEGHESSATRPGERSAKLPGPPARTLKLEKPGWGPRSASAFG